MPPLLRATDLHKRLGDQEVVRGVDLDLHAGRVLGLLGPNGAGKTTTIRMLYGLLRPDRGEVLIDGQNMREDLAAAKRLIGVCTQDDTADGDFSVRQNLMIMRHYFRPAPTDCRRRAEALIERFALAPHADKKPEQLSGGYRRRLLIARALMHEPRILFLDEPTTGLDPDARVALWELIAELRRDGLAIVLTTHYMDEAEQLSDELVLLKEGAVANRGSVRSILGSMMGEHVLVLADDERSAAAHAWLADHCQGDPIRVLGLRRYVLDAEALAAFTGDFGDLPFEVRKPSLDDLFLRLAEQGP